MAGISRVGKTGNLVTMKWRGAKLEVNKMNVCRHGFALYMLCGF